MRLNPLAYSLLVICGGMLAINNANADDQAVDLPLMVTSATGYKQQALRAPASVTVISSDEVIRKPVSDLAEVFRDIPGVDVVDSGVPGMKRLSLRGEHSRRVLIKVNGQPIPDHSTYGTPLLIDANMIEKIEVVRGAASVVHGSNAVGGVVNIVTRRAQSGGQEFNVGAGFYSATRGYRVHAGAMGGDDVVDWRIQMSQADFGDRRIPSNIESKPVGEELVSRKRLVNSESEQRAFSAEVGVRLDERQRVAWQGDYFRQEANAWMPPALPMDMSLDFPKRDSTRNALSYTFEDDSAVVHTVEARAYTQRGTRIMDNVMNLDMSPLPVKFDQHSRSNDELTTYGAQLVMASYLFGTNNTVFGAEYQMDKLDVDKNTVRTTYLPNPNLPPMIQETPSDQASEQYFWSAFVQQQIGLSDTLEANIGARYYNIESELKRSTERDTAKKSDDQFVGSGSLVWQTTDSSSLRFNVSQGYTYPSLTQQFSASPGNNAMNYGNPDLKAEKSTTYEVGSRIDGKKATVDFTIYHSQAKDFINKRPLNTGDAVNGFAACSDDYCFEWFNANKAETTGAELMAAYQIEMWRPYMNVAVQKRRLKYNQPATFKTWDSGLPIYQGRAGLEWQAMPKLDLDFYVRSYGKAKRQDFDSQGNPEIQRATSYAELNLAAYYQATQKLSVSAQALNLTNRSYRHIDELPAAERALDVEVNWRF